MKMSNIRGSARGIPEFHVFEALNFCKDLLGKFGGHKAAGGSSLSAEWMPCDRASTFAHQCRTRTPQAAPEIDAQA